LDVGGVGDVCVVAADAHGVDLARDGEISGADDEVCGDLCVLIDEDITCGLDGGAPVSCSDVDITDAESSGAVGAGGGFGEGAVG